MGYSSISTVYLSGCLNIAIPCRMLALSLAPRVFQHPLIPIPCIFCDSTSISPRIKCINTIHILFVTLSYGSWYLWMKEWIQSKKCNSAGYKFSKINETNIFNFLGEILHAFLKHEACNPGKIKVSSFVFR